MHLLYTRATFNFHLKTTNMRKVSRSEYDTLKANCAALINKQMAVLNLTPSAVQKQTAQWAMDQTEQFSVSMSDLHHYRTALTLPKAGKIQVLAKLLKCEPTDLVPKAYWHDKVRVYRKTSHARPDALNDREIEVKPHPDCPGHVILEARVTLPAVEGHKLAKVLSDRHYIADARRRGMTEEWIRDTFGKEPQRFAPDGIPIVRE